MLSLLRRCALPAMSTARLVPASFLCADNLIFGARLFSSSSVPASKSSTVWVGGLPYTTTAADMAERFGEFGTIEKVQMQATADGSPRGTCLIKFASPAEAAAALVMDRRTFGTRWMTVKKHLQHESVAERFPAIKPSPKIWIGGLPFETTADEIHQRFGSFGSISDVTFNTRFDGSPSGMCYVTYASTDAAAAAVASMNKATFGPRYVHVKLHYDRAATKKRSHDTAQQQQPVVVASPRDYPVNRAFFGNIPFTCTESDLEEIFATCGEVTDLFIYRDKQTQRSRGHGYVQYKDAGSAAAAVRDVHGTVVGGRELSVELPKGLRRAAVSTSTSVLVTNLPEDVEDDTLRSMFEHCGEIAQLRRAPDLRSAKIVFGSVESAQEAKGLAGADIDGRAIDVQLTNDKQ
ncbi:hypothetical protein B5M09_005856 [Aphanomyces astaci]|nr:hypothetical protein B5M09_005856 [Aphanomyces astaci]